MLWVTFGLLLVFWWICYALHIGGGLITYLMGIAFLILVIRTAHLRTKPSGADRSPRSPASQD
jgi:hypothetical protein